MASFLFWYFAKRDRCTNTDIRIEGGRWGGWYWLCLCVTKPSDLWESLGRSIMANCSATHHQYPRQSCVAGRRRSRAVKNEAEETPSGAWRDAEGDINGGNTGVHWHFSTAWSMRPINPHEDTYRSGTPHQTALQFLPAPKPSQMSRCKYSIHLS